MQSNLDGLHRVEHLALAGDAVRNSAVRGPSTRRCRFMCVTLTGQLVEDGHHAVSVDFAEPAVGVPLDRGAVRSTATRSTPPIGIGIEVPSLGDQVICPSEVDRHSVAVLLGHHEAFEGPDRAEGQAYRFDNVVTIDRGRRVGP